MINKIIKLIPLLLVATVNTSYGMSTERKCALTLLPQSAQMDKYKDRGQSFAALGNLIKYLLFTAQTLSPDELEEWIDRGQNLKPLIQDSLRASTFKVIAMAKLLLVLESSIGLNPRNWEQVEQESFVKSVRQWSTETKNNRKTHEDSTQETRLLPQLRHIATVNVPEVYDWEVSPQFLLEGRKLRIKSTVPYQSNHKYALWDDRPELEETRNNPIFMRGTSLFENPGRISDIHIFDFQGKVYLATIHLNGKNPGHYLLKILKSGDSIPIVVFEFQSHNAVPRFSKLFEFPVGGFLSRSAVFVTNQLNFIDIKELENLVTLHYADEYATTSVKHSDFRNIRVFPEDTTNLVNNIRESIAEHFALMPHFDLMIPHSTKSLDIIFASYAREKMLVRGLQFSQTKTKGDQLGVEDYSQPRVFRLAFNVEPSLAVHPNFLGAQFFQLRGNDYLVCVFNWFIVILDPVYGAVLDLVHLKIDSDLGFSMQPIRYENESAFLVFRSGKSTPKLSTFSLAGPAETKPEVPNE